MVDSEKFINKGPDGGLQGVDFGGLASLIINSYFLASVAGLISVLSAIFSLPGDLLEDALTWVGSATTKATTEITNSFSTAWAEAELIFPITGGFDFVLGVVIVMVFFISVRWMIQQVMEGL